MKSVHEIQEEFKRSEVRDWKTLCEQYRQDKRKGVASLVARYEKKLLAIEEEKKRMEQMFAYEREYDHLGYVCGIDEAGRGPLAGPVVAGAVILPGNCDILYLNDSKKLSAKKREELYEVIQREAGWDMPVRSGLMRLIFFRRPMKP